MKAQDSIRLDLKVERNRDHNQPDTINYHLAELRVASDTNDLRRLQPEFPPHYKTVLDIGCGVGQTLISCNLKPDTLAYGVDVDEEALAYGRKLNPHINFIRASGERLPFPDQYFDVVISRVALPYMDLPMAFSEISRILKPNGQVWFSLHPFSMVAHDFLEAITRLKVKNTVYLSYVMLNSLSFHLLGKLFRYPLKKDRLESFQTTGGVIRALGKAGFTDIRAQSESVFHVKGTTPRKVGTFLIVLARNSCKRVLHGFHAIWLLLNDFWVEAACLLEEGIVPLEIFW
jgi:ubiquinone/menaquinone biosynthesis C-methylase UbiE